MFRPISVKADMHQYLALRGINVCRYNIIRMGDLAAFFGKAGFAELAACIPSCNILFSADEKDEARLTGRIEQVLSDTFPYDSWAGLIIHGQLKGVVKGAPRQFGGVANR